MGWTNFIIIPKLRLIIEVSRKIDNIADYQKDALSFLIDEERVYEIEEYDIENKTAKDLKVKDLTQLFNIYEKANILAGMLQDEIFIYWLESKDINYEIKSEFEVNENKILEKYKEEGYTILRMCDN